MEDPEPIKTQFFAPLKLRLLLKCSRLLGAAALSLLSGWWEVGMGGVVGWSWDSAHVVGGGLISVNAAKWRGGDLPIGLADNRQPEWSGMAWGTESVQSEMSHLIAHVLSPVGRLRCRLFTVCAWRRSDRGDDNINCIVVPFRSRRSGCCLIHSGTGSSLVWFTFTIKIRSWSFLGWGCGGWNLPNSERQVKQKQTQRKRHLFQKENDCCFCGLYFFSEAVLSKVLCHLNKSPTESVNRVETSAILLCESRQSFLCLKVQYYANALIFIMLSNQTHRCLCP